MDEGDVHNYDKAKYHSQSCVEEGLSDDHSFTHTAVFFNWLAIHDFLDPELAGLLGDNQVANHGRISKDTKSMFACHERDVLLRSDFSVNRDLSAPDCTNLLGLLITT